MSLNTKPSKLGLKRRRGSRWKQWFWFVGLYITSLIVIGSFMFIVRTLLGLN